MLFVPSTHGTVVRSGCVLCALALVLVVTVVRAEPRRKHKKEPAGSPASSAATKTKPERSEPKAAGPLSGRVVFVTSEQAYLDKGRDNGLPVERGENLELIRGKTRSRCRVDVVADTTATCVGDNLAVGDRFEVVERPSSQKAKPLPPPVAEPELRRRLAVLQGKPPPPVDYKSKEQLLSLPVSGTVVLQDAYWSSVPSTGAYRQERVDVSLRSDNLPAGFRGYADFRVLVWSRRPTDARAPPTKAALWVTSAEFVRRPEEGGFSFSLGRTWPSYAPGLAMIDGLTASWRFEGLQREVGIFAGYLPDPLNLHLATQQSTTGAFFMQQWRGETNRDPLARVESRLAWVAKPWAPSRLEWETALTAMSENTSGNIQVLAGLAGDVAPRLDAVRMDVRRHFFRALTLHGGARYQREAIGNVMELGDPTRGARSLTTDVAMSLDAGPYLYLSTFARGVRDLETRMQQLQFGGEIAWLHGFGTGSRLSVGHQEERGWLPGRTANLQWVIHPWKISTLIARASVSQYLRSAALPDLEAGLYMSGQVRLGTLLWLRLAGLARADVSRTVLAPRPWGYQVTGSMGGSF